MDSKLEDMSGGHYHIEETLVISPPAKSKSKETVKIVLSARNSFFVDVETVQRMMVRLYGITNSGMSTFMLILLFFFNFAAISFAAVFVLGAGLSAIMNAESRRPLVSDEPDEFEK